MLNLLTVNTRANRLQARASTLAEVLIGMVVLALVVVSVLGILVQSSYLEQTDADQTEVLAIAQGLMETQVDTARTLEGYESLQTVALTPAFNPDFLYSQTITEMPLDMKRISVSVFYADPQNPSIADSSRAREGHALTLSVAVAEPTE